MQKILVQFTEKKKSSFSWLFLSFTSLNFYFHLGLNVKKYIHEFFGQTHISVWCKLPRHSKFDDVIDKNSKREVKPKFEF